MCVAVRCVLLVANKTKTKQSDTQDVNQSNIFHGVSGINPSHLFMYIYICIIVTRDNVAYEDFRVLDYSYTKHKYKAY